MSRTALKPKAKPKKVENPNLLWLVTGKHLKKQAWWFVQVQPLKEPLFKKALKTPKLGLNDYGQIVESGYGARPTAAVIEALCSRGYSVNESLFG